ncbi:hypothetical protein IQ260_15820 [Leptolyngbya cf. ectocarpi LEGE 11479]|uniref:Uncharacterized protein n=1 Tax=Leptolyngbya cf. ectocarpi LEGE 11479 TaxID=1828722 RepID=A0A929F6D5_LEPEC|nr:hypothetical protein [Leptolyngbya ectocarpi]MBE9068120.1 hypothetical protein [Leptolyngbya cf. ectocarpi LEGE 11479]
MTEIPTNRNTKAQILEAYNDLLKERNKLEKQVDRLKTTSPTSGTETKPSEPVKVMNQPPVDQTQDKMKATIHTLAGLQAGFGSAVNELSEKLTSKAAQLQALRSAVAEELAQLEELHSLDDIQADTLDTLIQTCEDTRKAFEAEFTQRQDTLDHERRDLKQSWVKEQEDHKRSIKERDDEQKKASQRESEEYDYNLTLERSLAQADYAQAQEERYRQLAEAKQALAAQWAEREGAIARQEQHFAELKAQVEAFEAEKEAAIKQAKEEAGSAASAQAKIAADLRHKELDGFKRVYELRIQALEHAIATNEERIQTVSKQLAAALKQVQDLAVKAIEGASNIQSFEAFKSLAMEQAKTQMKGK